MSHAELVVLAGERTPVGMGARVELGFRRASGFIGATQGRDAPAHRLAYGTGKPLEES